MKLEKSGRVLCLQLLLLSVTGTFSQKNYYGKLIGQLQELEHDVKGEVFAVDSRTLHIRGFSYDGTAPDAFFFVGATPRPSDNGVIVPDGNGSKEPLQRYRNQHVTITLPDGLTLRDVKWLSVWCRAFTVNFGHVMIPSGLQYPRPQKIDSISTLEHDVSSGRVVVVDAQTFLIPNFNYDGTAPDAHFWVGKGRPRNQGIVVPDENGSSAPIKKYSGKTIVITLPGDLTVFDIDYLSIWCKAFSADFGHVSIPKNLNVPPSLKMLGVAPQTKLNCEVLWDELAFEVRWAVAGESIVMQLVGRIENGDYMAFGLSGADSRSVMVGGDIVASWLDQNTGRGEAVDYHLNGKAQCQDGKGSCPDETIRGSANNVRLLNAALINDFTMLTFQRPLKAVDNSDRAIYTNGSQAVIWAVGPVNSQGHTSYHHLRSRGDVFIDFGRTPRWNCPLPEEQSSSRTASPVSSGPSKPAKASPPANPWFIPHVPCYEPEDGIFYAQIGPTGGQSGYNAITGHVGWGIAWYINGLLIPEIHLVRGKTYTFVVEGGLDPENSAKFHPFYITDDPEGGYAFKTPAERSQVRVFAGIDNELDGSIVPTAFGRLCEWKEDRNQKADSFESFGAYQRSLTLNCDEGQPGILQWTPDASTPDTVYYQCYTHRFLGWKIRVVDECPLSQAASEILQPQAVPAPPGWNEDSNYYDSNPYGYGDVYPTRLQRKDEYGLQSDDYLNEPFNNPDFPSVFSSDFDDFALKAEENLRYNPSLMKQPNLPEVSPEFSFPKFPNFKKPSGALSADAFAHLANQTRDVPPEFFDPHANWYDFSTLELAKIPEVEKTGGALHDTHLTQSQFSGTKERPLQDVPSLAYGPYEFKKPNQLSFESQPPFTKSPYRQSYSTISRPKKPQHATRQSPVSSLPPTKMPTFTTHQIRERPNSKVVSTQEPSNQGTSNQVRQSPYRKRPLSDALSEFSKNAPFAVQKPPKKIKTPFEKDPSSPTIKEVPQLTIIRNPVLSSTSKYEIITAASLPTLPGQLSFIVTNPPLIVKSRPTPKPIRQSQLQLRPGFKLAKNTGFDPSSVIFESDFVPIRRQDAPNLPPGYRESERPSFQVPSVVYTRRTQTAPNSASFNVRPQRPQTFPAIDDLLPPPPLAPLSSQASSNLKTVRWHFAPPKHSWGPRKSNTPFNRRHLYRDVERQRETESDNSKGKYFELPDGERSHLARSSRLDIEGKRRVMLGDDDLPLYEETNTAANLAEQSSPKPEASWTVANRTHLNILKDVWDNLTSGKSTKKLDNKSV